MVQIISQLRRVATCTEQEKRVFYQLLCQSFLGVSWNAFVRDFAEKEAIIILRKEHEAGEIVGFSTLMVLTLTIAGEEVKGIFSGDTVVVPEYRSSTGLAWLGSYFMQVWESYPQHKVYYILISKGWRTYKLLPIFFREFSPCTDRPTPALDKAVMHAFGTLKYPQHYDSNHSVVHFDGEAARLRPGSIDVLPNKLDAHTRFFLRANPHYLQGDELVCVARVTPDNFASGLRRLLGMGRVGGMVCKERV